MRLSASFLTLISLLLLQLQAHAGPALDRDVINRWAASMEEFKGWDDESLDEDEDIDFDFDPTHAELPDFEASMTKMARENPEARRIVRRHGFTPEQWGNAGARIMRAYGAMMMGEEAPEMDREMQAQMRELENNPHISEQQKQMIRQQMQAASGMMRQMTDAPEADVRAVRANRARLDQVFAEDQD